MSQLMEWKKMSRGDQEGQENDCSGGCAEGSTLRFIVSILGRMQTFHTCAWATVEVVGAVMNKQEVNSLTGILWVCRPFMEVCLCGNWGLKRHVINGLIKINRMFVCIRSFRSECTKSKSFLSSKVVNSCKYSSFRYYYITIIFITNACLPVNSNCWTRGIQLMCLWCVHCSLLLEELYLKAMSVVQVLNYSSQAHAVELKVKW